MFVLDGAVTFFDLGGTLVRIDGRIPDRHKAVLRELGRRTRVVLVTGQPFDDPQVQEVLSVFADEPNTDFVAYLTRGGLRLTCGEGGFKRDALYLSSTRLTDALRRDAEEEVARALAACGLTPLVPVRCVDDIAVRVNLPPADRPRFVSAVRQGLAARGVPELQVLSEGRTSVYVTRHEVGKRRAVEHELGVRPRDGGTTPALYFGNEFAPGGNDHEVLGIPGLVAFALGPCDPPHGCTIGEGPDDLYAALLHALRRESAPRHRLPAVCLSLGGTKLALGAMTAVGTFLPSAEFFWRGEATFTAPDADGAVFCAALLDRVRSFLRERGYALGDVGVLGLPFPGPERGGRWYSHNLTEAFRAGVPLAATLARQLPGGPPVRVVFDAQCDAGGERYHPRGRLYGETDPTATVLNVATGIAAGLVYNGRVMLTDEEVRAAAGPPADGGAGQVGRHLWYRHAARRWEYHFAPAGGVPSVPGATRLTERLSGPALAARLLRRLAERDALPTADNWGVRRARLEDLDVLRSAVSGVDEAAAAQLTRSCRVPVASSLLEWADAVTGPSAEVVRAFGAEVAADLAAALVVWFATPGWGAFGRHVVLTGGVGMRFLAAGDADPGGFLRVLADHLPCGSRVERSRLSDPTERECYLFLAQP